MNTLFGTRVMADTLMPEFVPKMQLSKKCEAVLAPAFAAEMNAWMFKFFGGNRHVMLYTDPGDGTKIIFAHPNTIAVLHKQKGPQ